MKNNNWKEIEPPPCAICKCCKINPFEGTIMCCKYEKEYDCRIGYTTLYERCKCHKNYPSFWSKLIFRFMCFLQYIEDIKYHRFDD